VVEPTGCAGSRQLDAKGRSVRPRSIIATAGSGGRAYAARVPGEDLAHHRRLLGVDGQARAVGDDRPLVFPDRARIWIASASCGSSLGGRSRKATSQPARANSSSCADEECRCYAALQQRLSGISADQQRDS